jgi:hypothetical protein
MIVWKLFEGRPQSLTLYTLYDDLTLKAGIEIAALLCHTNLLEWWIVNLSRCPDKLDHYNTHAIRSAEGVIPPFLISVKSRG